MNGPVSITFPMPTIIIQFPSGHDQNNGFPFPCIHCGLCNRSQTNDMKEEKIEVVEDVIDINEEKINIKEENIDITEEEYGFNFEMNEHILHKGLDLYGDIFSPISNTESEDEENNEPSVSGDQDERFGDFPQKCFNDISEIVHYLKQDVI